MATTNRETPNAVRSRIPTFRTVEEEAEFWDTHSSEEFADELEEVDDVQIVGIRRGDVLSLRFSTNELEALEARAATEEVGPAILVRRWILERLEPAAPIS